MIIPTKSKHIVMNLPVHSLNEEIITESMPLGLAGGKMGLCSKVIYGILDTC